MNNDREIMNFLKDNIPIILDLESGDLKFDSRSIYFKIYKYIVSLKDELKTYKGE